MSDDKKKSIPTLEVPTLEEVIQPGKSTPAAKPKGSVAAKPTADQRKQPDRRQKQEPLAEGQADRRKEDRRATDKRRNQELDELVEKIMADMMPDLEQHLFMQLRFELLKHMPKILSEFKDKN